MATGLREQLAGFWPRPPDGEATKRTSQPRGAGATARAKGLRTGRRPWRGTRPGRWLGSATAGGSPRPRDPHAADSVSATRGASPERVPGGESKPAAAGAAEGGGLCAGEGARERRARRQPPGVWTGLRTARPPASPAARAVCAGRAAPAISGAARRGGEGEGGCAVSDTRSGREEALGGSLRRWKRRRRRRRWRRELEKSVSGELIEKGSGGGALRRVETKRTPYLSH